MRALNDAALTRRTERVQTGGMQVRSYKYRLRPSRAQAEALDAMLRDFCGLYNAGLQQRVEAYRRRGMSLRLKKAV